MKRADELIGGWLQGQPQGEYGLGEANAEGANRTKVKRTATNEGHQFTPVFEFEQMKDVLYRAGYEQITDDAQYANDAVTGHHRFRGGDGTKVTIDRNPDSNSHQNVFSFHAPHGSTSGYGHHQLGRVIMKHQLGEGVDEFSGVSGGAGYVNP
jgi:hypothetical protein